MKWNTNTLGQDLNSGHQLHFLQRHWLFIKAKFLDSNADFEYSFIKHVEGKSFIREEKIVIHNHALVKSLFLYLFSLFIDQTIQFLSFSSCLSVYHSVLKMIQKYLNCRFANIAWWLHGLARYCWRRSATRFSNGNNINSPVSRSRHLVN